MHCSGFYGYPFPTHTVFYDYIVTYRDARRHVADVSLHFVGTEALGPCLFSLFSSGLVFAGLF